MRGCLGPAELGDWTLRWTWEHMPSLPQGMGRLGWTAKRTGWKGGTIEFHGGGSCGRSGAKACALKGLLRALGRLDEAVDFGGAAARRALAKELKL